jgi:peptide deformylase
MMKRIFITGAVLVAALSCGRSKTGGFSSGELEILNSADSIMRVLTIEDSLDHAVLRDTSRDFSLEELSSEEFKKLGRGMVATVTHPSQDGVGIAGPQVGLNRRIVAVQRFDKEGEPFEVYANVRIVWMSDLAAYGPEGCLSVPDRREQVLRSQEIVVEYADLTTLHQDLDDIPMKRDTVTGFTAVIFQHEIDHLEGVLYIDRL